MTVDSSDQDQSVDENSRETTGVKVSVNYTPSVSCDDSQNESDDDREDDEAINLEVRDVIDYMLDLVEVVVPFAPTERQRKQALGTKKDDSPDEMSSSDIEDSDDCLEVIEEKLPVELTVEIEPKLVGEDNYVLDYAPNGLCFICASSKKKFQVLKNGVVQSLCSDNCLNKLKTLSAMKCMECKLVLPADSTIYHPKFGAIGSNICSVTCLNKYEETKGPKAKCRTCMKIVTSSGKSYHWQTMDFCSSKCIENVFKSVGGFCVNCKSQVNDSALGKYSVRFGDVVRQFCCVKCLEQYKRRLKSCSFCQKELNQSLKQTVYFKDSNGPMKPREFCNNQCVMNYKEIREKKIQQDLCEPGEFEEAEFCSICSVYVETNNDAAALETYKIDHGGQTYFCCSKTCVAALRYQLAIKTLICDGCYKFNWPLAGGTVLRFSGKIKIFCTKRCQSLFVLRTRKIQVCICCKVKKYAFDLVEQYNHENGLSVLFCSLNCMNILVETDNVNEKLCQLGKIVHHAKCYTCKKVARESNSKIFHMEDLTRGIRSFCSYQCVVQFKNKLKQEQEEARINQQLLAKHAATRLGAVASEQPTDRWTPNFSVSVANRNIIQIQRGQTQPRAANQAAQSVPKHNYSTRTATGSVPIQPVPSQQTAVQIRAQPQQKTPQRPLPNILQRNQNLTATLNGISQQVRQQQQQTILAQPQVPKKTEVLLMKQPAKQMVNKAMQICSSCITKATQCRPSTREMAVQTEE